MYINNIIIILFLVSFKIRISSKINFLNNEKKTFKKNIF